MIGIIGAMEEEVCLLRDSLSRMETTVIGGLELYHGRLSGKEVALLRCGIGKVNAAVGCTLLVDRYKPGFVVNTGSAGGIKSELTFGDVVVSEGLLQHDVDVTAFGYQRGQVPGLPAVFPAAAELVERAERAVDQLKTSGALASTLNHVRGIVGSGDLFVHEAEAIAAIRARFPRVLAVEMEGAAIAQVCALFGVPFVAIRALSDIAGKESPMKFDEFLPLAARNSSEIVRRIVELS